MTIATVVFLLREEHDLKEVLLAAKLRTYGIGVLNGYGGKVGTCESIKDCAVRETSGESGVRVFKKHLVRTAVVKVYKCGRERFELHIFLAYKWRGIPRETAEMGEPRWYPIKRLPLLDLFPDDCVWLPLALSGERFEAEVYLSPEEYVDRVVFREAQFT